MLTGRATDVQESGKTVCMLACIFFFSSRRRHTRYWRDWSSDVCSSDLPDPNATEGLRTKFRSRLPRNRKAERSFAQAERDIAEPASPRSRNRPLGTQDQQRLEVGPWQQRSYFRCRICGGERGRKSGSILVVI